MVCLTIIQANVLVDEVNSEVKQTKSRTYGVGLHHNLLSERNVLALKCRWNVENLIS